MKRINLVWHIMALITVMIWGTTFVSTKYLINNGIGPIEIMVFRFFIAYIILFAVCPKINFISLKEEIKFIVMGITGGTLYFITENNAIGHTFASNVALIVCMAPVLTAVLAHFFTKDEKLKITIVVGFFIAMLGIAIIIFNGKFILKLSPIGDVLALCSALSWAFYSILLKNIGEKYNYIFITKKILFYSLLTSLPFLFFTKGEISYNIIFRYDILLNLVFLGVVASALCYIIWHNAINKIGMIVSSNYIYLSPLITVIASKIIIKENISLLTVIGGIFIISGVLIAQMKK